MSEYTFSYGMRFHNDGLEGPATASELQLLRELWEVQAQLKACKTALRAVMPFALHANQTSAEYQTACTECLKQLTENNG